MSKHEKQVRRERKKTDRARRLRVLGRHPTSHIPHAGAAALAAAAAIAAGTSAYAAPVRFDNPTHGDPGHVHWPPAVGLSFRLDITQDPSQQPGGGADPAVVAQTNGGSYTQVDSALASFQVGGQGNYMVVGVSGGDLIPSGLPWGSFGYIYSSSYGGSELPEGQATYLGVRFNLGGGYQYGWIGGVRSGMDVEAFAWGYETDVGVPVAAGAPEPGSLALLAFGACAALRRRRA